MGAISKVEDQAAAAWAQEGLRQANDKGQVKLAFLLEAVRDDISFELQALRGAPAGGREGVTRRG